MASEAKVYEDGGCLLAWAISMKSYSMPHYSSTMTSKISNFSRLQQVASVDKANMLHYDGRNVGEGNSCDDGVAEAYCLRKRVPLRKGVVVAPVEVPYRRNDVLVWASSDTLVGGDGGSAERHLCLSNRMMVEEDAIYSSENLCMSSIVGIFALAMLEGSPS